MEVTWAPSLVAVCLRVCPSLGLRRPALCAPQAIEEDGHQRVGPGDGEGRGRADRRYHVR